MTIIKGHRSGNPHLRAGDPERPSDHSGSARLGHRTQRGSASRPSAQGKRRPPQLQPEDL